MLKSSDIQHLVRCVELAQEALESGDEPFGSVLVGSNGDVLREERNKVDTMDLTRHPEFELTRWAAGNLSRDERASATVYTSGEHCPMCSAAHGFVGLGQIVYASSSRQLTEWLSEFGVTPSLVTKLRINDVVPSVHVQGPALELAEDIRELHRRYHKGVNP